MPTITCSNCGAQNDDDSTFCSNCGQELHVNLKNQTEHVSGGWPPHEPIKILKGKVTMLELIWTTLLLFLFLSPFALLTIYLINRYLYQYTPAFLKTFETVPTAQYYIDYALTALLFVLIISLTLIILVNRVEYRIYSDQVAVKIGSKWQVKKLPLYRETELTLWRKKWQKRNIGNITLYNPRMRLINKDLIPNTVVLENISNAEEVYELLKKLINKAQPMPESEKVKELLHINPTYKKWYVLLRTALYSLLFSVWGVVWTICLVFINREFKALPMIVGGLITTLIGALAYYYFYKSKYTSAEYSITDQYIEIDFNNIKKECFIIPLNENVDVRLKQGWLQKLFQLWTIKIKSTEKFENIYKLGKMITLSMANIAEPEKALNLIVSLLNEFG